jgi:glycosyltransferase involved in cell wall biosynthesis
MSTSLATRPERLGGAICPEAQAYSAGLDDQPRRVLVVVRWPVGGIRTHILYNYSDPVFDDYQFTFVGPDDQTFDTFAASLRHLDGAEYVGVPVRGEKCRLWPAVRRLLRTGRFGLLHCHGVTAGAHGALANFGLGVPHLTTVHDVFRPTQFPGFRGRLKRWLLGRVLRRASTLISVTTDVRANLIEYLPAVAGRPRLPVIPNGINSARYRMTPGGNSGELRTRLGLDGQTMLFGFLGRFMEQKGFLPLLEALRRLKACSPSRPFHLVAIGSGDCRQRYRRVIETLGLSGCVTLLEFVPDVLPLLRQFDLLVVPSLWEASSLVSMEAMAAGVPVLGSNCIGLREVLRDTPSRMVAAGDPSVLCRGLLDALESPWTAAAHAFAATARERFDNRPSARQLEEIYAEAFARRSCEPAASTGG